jgi:hypothetical protein
MIRKIRQNFNSWRDVLLFYRVLCLITVLPILVKWNTLPRLMNRLTPLNNQTLDHSAADHTSAKIIKYTDFILGWGIGVWKRTCLKRSLVLYHFLRDAGMPVHVCFGVRIQADAGRKSVHGQLEGHAWLRHGGGIFLENDPEMTRTYMETYRFPVMNQEGRCNG